MIDLVVASHRHQDHIAGFTDARWGDVTVGEVWLPWCEDPADTEAQRLRTRLDGAARTLHQRFAVDGPEIAAIALNSLSNERAMTTLRDGFGGQPSGASSAQPHPYGPSWPVSRTPASTCWVRRARRRRSRRWTRRSWSAGSP